MNPTVLLHGALGSVSQLTPLKLLLEKSGRQVYTMNFSGHSGEPFTDTFGIETFVENLHDFLKENGLKQVDIFGYSMGGYVAVWYALLHQNAVSKIVTLGTKFDWSIESAEKEVKKLNADKIEEKIPAFARILEKRHAPNDWKELLEKTSDMMLALGKNPMLTERNLTTITTPVTICLGDLDDMADRAWSEHVAEILPNGVFRFFENTSHPIEKVDLSNVIKVL